MVLRRRDSFVERPRVQLQRLVRGIVRKEEREETRSWRGFGC